MSDQELYLCSPPGYPFGQRIAKSDIGGLKSFLIGTTPDDAAQELVRQMNADEVYRSLESNGFTFEENWRPPQEISLDQAVEGWRQKKG